MSTSGYDLRRESPVHFLTWHHCKHQVRRKQRHVTSRHVTSRCVTSYCVPSRHIIFITSHHLMSCHVHATLRHLTSCFMSRHVTSHHVMSRHVMLIRTICACSMRDSRPAPKHQQERHCSVALRTTTGVIGQNIKFSLFTPGETKHSRFVVKATSTKDVAP